jgi:hypothetical protein
MNETLFLAIKSTLDRILFDQVGAMNADFPLLEFSETDDMVQVQEALGTSSPALLYTVSNPAPAPRSPLFVVEFAMGAKTVQDKGNYQLADLISRLQAIFSVGAVIEIRNYSGTTGQAPLVARLKVVGVAPEYQRYDKIAGLRMFGVSARGLEIA